jgi:hypothetical protein
MGIIGGYVHVDITSECWAHQAESGRFPDVEEEAPRDLGLAFCQTRRKRK